MLSDTSQNQDSRLTYAVFDSLVEHRIDTNGSVFDSYLFRIGRRLASYLISPRFNNAQKRALVRLSENYSPKARRKRAHARASIGVAPEGYVLGITDRCNLSCRYCYSSSSPSKKCDMDLDAAYALITEMYDAFGITFVTISGGEPFPKVIPLAARCRSTVFYVYTNGTTLSKDCVAEIKKLGNVIPSLSILGPEWKHDSIRGTGSFAAVINAVNELTHQNLVWGFSVTESQVNIGDILDGTLFSLLSEYRPHFLRMIPFVPFGRKPSRDMVLKPRDRWSVAEAILRAKTKYKFPIHDYVNDESLGISCMAGGVRYFYVDPTFRMTPCVFMDAGQQIEYDLSKQRTNALDVLRNSAVMSKARELAKSQRCILLDRPNWRSEIDNTPTATMCKK